MGLIVPGAHSIPSQDRNAAVAIVFRAISIGSVAANQGRRCAGGAVAVDGTGPGTERLSSSHGRGDNDRRPAAGWMVPGNETTKNGEPFCQRRRACLEKAPFSGDLTARLYGSALDAFCFL